MPGPQLFAFTGFMGNTIDYQITNRKRVKLWPDYYTLATGGASKLRLNAAGDGPFEPYLADRLFVMDPISEYYDELWRELAKSFTTNWVRYDWRHSIRQEAALVWEAIKQKIGTAPFYLLGHSLGGLMARMVWRAAKLENRDNQVVRILTLGTPHWGTYAAAWTFSHRDQTYRDLVTLTQGITTAAFPLISIGMDVTFQAGPIGEVDKITTSWPALYELLPMQTEPNHFAYDPLRQELYDLANWTSFNKHMSIDQLVNANGITHSQLQGAIPPDSKMVSVYATGFPTAAALAQPLGRLSSSRSYVYEDGDGRVTVKSAVLGLHKKEVQGTEHANLPRDPQILSEVAALLLNVPGPPLPPDPPNPGFIPPAPGLPAPAPPYTIPFVDPPFPGTTSEWLPSVHDC